jgi:hypothetical protein
VTAANDAATLCNSYPCAFVHVYDNGGVGVLAFFGLCFLFYKLIWKVWRSMIKSKDQEIERLTKERNFYQDKLFPERLTTDIPPGPVQPSQPRIAAGDGDSG